MISDVTPSDKLGGGTAAAPEAEAAVDDDEGDDNIGLVDAGQVTRLEVLLLQKNGHLFYKLTSYFHGISLPRDLFSYLWG